MSAAPTARARVRDLVAELLVDGVPAVAGRVFRARTWAMTEDELPALLVYGWDEEKKAAGEDALAPTFDVSLFLAVQIRIADSSRDTEAGEAELEELSGAVCDAVMKSPGLTAPPDGPVERISSVKTTFGIDTASGELALGRCLIVFELKWHEVYELPLPAIDCDCDETSLALRITPNPSAP